MVWNLMICLIGGTDIIDTISAVFNEASESPSEIRL
jgi:hypothetical protein